MEDLTLDEIKSLPWVGNETHALVNRETKEIVHSSDCKEWLEGNLRRMTPKHPLYPKLQLVERPKSN